MVTSLLPWVRTGARERSSYELLAAARRLGVLTSGFERGALVVWPFLPLLVALGWLAFALGRRRAAAVAVVVAGVLAVTVAADVWQQAALTPLTAVRGTIVLGVLTVGGAGVALALERRAT